jgi:hypothetical protein
MRALGEDDVSSDFDTVDHLMPEASIGRLYHLLHTTAMCTFYDEVEVDPLFLPSLVHMIEACKELKWDFVRRHQKWEFLCSSKELDRHVYGGQIFYKGVRKLGNFVRRADQRRFPFILLFVTKSHINSGDTSSL